MKRLLHSILFLLPTTLALSQTDTTKADTVYYLSPITISATLARERITPATFSNLNREKIRERYFVQDVPELLSELPSITSYSENGNGIGYNYVNLRGFDQRRLSIMINGVPQNDPEDHNVYWIDVPDLMSSTGNIQVQRGAGSAFYGPPAIGGSINIITNPFQQKAGVTLESMYGFQEFGAGKDPASGDTASVLQLNTKKFSASFNSGLIDRQYMFYGKLGKILSDGYRKNSWVEYDSYFFGAVRFDKDVTTRLHFFGGPIADGLAYYGLPKFANDEKKLRRLNLVYWDLDSTGKTLNTAIARRQQEVENFSQPHYELIQEWRVTNNLTFNHTMFYYTGDGYFDYDASWADTSMLRLGQTYGIPTSLNPANTLVRGFVGNAQWGWLPRMDIDHELGTLTVGAEIRIHRSTHWGKIQFAENLPPNFDLDYHFYEYNGEKDILSFYAHELFHPMENVTLMAELQLVRNRYGIKNERFLGNNFSLPYFFANPRFGVNYNINEQWNAYISLAYTSREPRLRNLYAAEDSYFGATPQFSADTTGGTAKYDFTKPIAKPERLFDVELGTSYRTSETHISLNLYWMEFIDELVKSGQVDVFGQPVTGNAERTRHLGIEADGSWFLTDHFSLNANASISRNKLIRYSVIDNGSRVSLDGNPIAGFPDVLGNLRVTYRDESLTASILMKHVGAFYTDNFKIEENKNDSYTVFNADVVCRLPKFIGTEFNLRGEVRNVFNKLYFMSGEGNAFFPAAERNYLFGLTATL